MSSRAKKRKLPYGWIVVNSKSHPDRIYYFNVRTNKSSWEEPTTDDEDTTNPSKQRRKSKSTQKDKDEYQSQLSRATTPELCTDDTKNYKRPILSARRRLNCKQNESPPIKETPQMKAIREKMLQRKSKATPQRVIKSLKDVEKSETDTSITSENSEIVSPKKAYTPQMRAILDKLKQKTDKPHAGKKEKEDSTSTSSTTDSSGSKTTSEDSTTTTSSSSSKSICSASTECIDKSKTVTNKRSVTKSGSTIRKEKSKSKIEGKIQKSPKNNAQKRMEVLRQSLQNEQDQSCKTTQNKNNESSDTQQQDVSPPNTYKNAEARLRRLRVKLLKEFANDYKKTCENKAEDDEHSVRKDGPSVQTLVHQCIDESFHEDMEWESIPAEQIAHEVNNIRIQLCMNDKDNTKTSIPQNALNITHFSKEVEKNPLYIVVDTNVFLTNLQTIEEARDCVFKMHGRPTIVIPWTVIRELDYLKDVKANLKYELRLKARKAINFLHHHFSSKHPRVLGQTLADVQMNKEKFAIDCPDDEILQTCLQIRESGKSVVLLSYDKNLCNKAMIHDVLILGRNEPLEKIDYLTAGASRNTSTPTLQIIANDGKTAVPSLTSELRITDEIFESAKSIMKSFLTIIVAKEMENLFGENWEKYTIIKPPWTIEGVLRCSIKHWMAAVSESFHRRAEPILKELLPAFTKFPEGGRKMSQVAHLLELCSDFIQLVHIGKHPDLMTNAFNGIDELKKKLSEYEKMIKQRSLENIIGLEDDTEKQLVRASKAFDYFDEIYNYSIHVCALAAKQCGMPFFLTPESDMGYSDDDLNQMQRELSANINHLINVLRHALEQMKNSSMDSRSLNSLFDTLVNFLPQDRMTLLNDKHGDVLEPLDVYCCLTQKQQLLEAGLGQLHELCTHLCRLATYRISS